MSGDSPTLVDLLRHGKPVGGDRYRGSVDDPLDPQGWRQMEQAVGNTFPWRHILTSPLKRCADFAQALGQRGGLPVQVDARFQEMGFGEWEGRDGAEILANDGERLMAFWRDPLHHPPPGGEPLPQVAKRAVAAFEEAIARHEGEHLLIVAHGGVIRVLIAHALLMPMEHLSRLLVPYAAMSRIRVDRVGERLMPRLAFHAAGSPLAP